MNNTSNMVSLDKYTNLNFANDLEKLTDEQMGQPAYYWGENCGGKTGYSVCELFVGWRSLALDGRRANAQATFQVPKEKIIRHITGITVLTEDYVDPSGDGSEPISNYVKGNPNYDPENGYDTIEEARKAYPVAFRSGSIIIELY